MNLNLTDCSSIKDQIKDLWQYSFSDPDDFMSLYFGKFWNGKNAVAALDGKALLGALELVPYKISLRGTLVDASYIVGVCTAPEARGRGVATKLMRGAIEKQGKRREVLSLLYPFSYSFYNRMGYAPCYQQARCEIPFERMPATHYSGRFFRPSLNDFTALSNVYENFCKGKNGFVRRTKAEWKFIFEMLNLENGHLYAYENEVGTVTAYMSFVKTTERFHVLEAAYMEPEGLQALLAFMSSHFSSYHHIELSLPANGPLPTMFNEPPVCELHPTVAARVLDISRAFSAGLGGLRINVTDDFCPENTGVYEEHGGGIVRYDSMDSEIQLDISALTQLVMGFYSAFDLAATGRLTGVPDAVLQLDRLYPKQRNYINHILTPSM